MYLSKPYDCLTHDLIITALEAEVLGQKNEVVLKSWTKLQLLDITNEQ